MTTEKEAQTDNSTYKTLAVQWLNVVQCSESPINAKRQTVNHNKRKI